MSIAGVIGHASHEPNARRLSFRTVICPLLVIRGCFFAANRSATSGENRGPAARLFR